MSGDWHYDTDIPSLIGGIEDLDSAVAELEPPVLEGDWETVRDALDALPEGAQIRWTTGLRARPELAVKRKGDLWSTTAAGLYFTAYNIAKDETPIEVIA